MQTVDQVRYQLFIVIQNAYDILTILYEDSDIYLDRKYKKYMEFAPLFRNK